jgi:hypothetical protein
MLLLSCTLACGDGPTGPSGLSLGDLVGSWTAVSFVTSAAGDSIDLVDLGGAMNVDISADGRITIATRDPGATDFGTETGTVQVVRTGVMRLSVGTPTEFSYTVSTTDLRFSGPSEADIDGDGVDDPVVVDAVFRRR